MPNLDKKNAAECTNSVLQKIEEISAQAMMDFRYQALFEKQAVIFLDFYEALEQSDLVIAVGGDGTIIHSAKHAVLYDKPLLGINVGRLGFMAGLEISELSLLSKLMEQQLLEEKRMMLKCSYHSKSGTKEFLALNDVVVSNGALSKIVDLDIHCNGKLIAEHRADGVILSTPTGSTAYALSAGGPIIEPMVECISLTPVCSHSLAARTILFSSDNKIQVSASEQNRHPIFVTIDGEEGFPLEKGEFLEVTKSDKNVRLVNLNEQSFYQVLNRKFKIGNNNQY